MSELKENTESWLSLAILLIGVIILATCSAQMAQGAELPYANGANWTTECYSVNRTGAAVDVNPTGLQKVPLAPYGVLRYGCGSPGFGVTPAPAGLDSSVLLAFDDHVTRASYVLGPLSPISQKVPSGRLAPIQNDKDRITVVNVFTSADVLVRVTYYDADGAEVGVKTADVKPPVAQIACPFDISAGSLVVETGDPQWNAMLPDVPVYGFVSVASPKGDNASVIPFK